MTAPAPILIVGGFLTDPVRYEQFGLALQRLSGRPVFVAPIGFSAWLAASLRDDFSPLLRTFAGSVKSILQGTAPLTIIAHSAGGVLARMFLGEEPYGPARLAYGGHRLVDRLITLGSPQRAARGGRQAGLNQVRWVMQHYPGAFWPNVEYLSVIGNGIQGRADGSFVERAAFASYRLFDGHGAQPGDGIIPLSCGMLEGARQLLLPDIFHGPRALRPWYGENEQVIARWWLA